MAYYGSRAYGRRMKKTSHTPYAYRRNSYRAAARGTSRTGNTRERFSFTAAGKNAPISKPSFISAKKKKKRRSYISNLYSKMPGRRNRLSETAFYAVIIVLAAVFTTLVYNVITGKTPRIDIRCVSEMKVSYNTVNSLYQLSARFGLPFDELLGVYMVENRFFPERDAGQTENALERLYIVNYNLIKSKYSEKKLAPYIEIFKVLLNEIKYYPVKWEDSGLYFDVTDEYYEYRSPGEIHGYMFGNGFSATGEQHYGTDVFDRESTPGRLTVVSMTSGTLEEMGENGSYGKYTTVLTDSGTRYYYRNLDSFSDGLAAGMRVNAGQSLGKMGRSGGSCIDGGLYVRLHVGIKIKSDLRSELWINPYIFLRIIEMYADNLYQAAI